jgi:hypothetical protein
LLGALQAFNTSNVRFLNPETSGETLAFTGLTVLVFLLLLLLLMLLLRNILKLYADQSSSALGARLRTRMVLGAALIALTPAVFMFLFSFSADEPVHRPLVFASPPRSCARTRRAWCWNWRNTSPTMRGLRRNRLRHRRAGQADLPSSGGAGLASHHAGGGFAVVYGKDCACWPVFRRRRSPARPACSLAGRRRAGNGGSAARAALRQPASAAQRSDESGASSVAGRSTRWAWRPPHRARWWWWRCPCPRD